MSNIADQEIRRTALLDAIKDVCIYCGRRATFCDSRVYKNKSGNYVHERLDDDESTDLCVANAIWKRLEFENIKK